MNNSLNQCQAGESFLKSIHLSNANRKFGVLTVFESQYSPTSNNSSIHFIDPATDSQNLFDSWGLILNYYLAIFKGFTRIQSLSDLMAIKSDTLILDGNSFKLFRIPLIDENLEMLSIPFLYKIGRLSFGISVRVLEMLIDKENQEKAYFAELEKLSKIKTIAQNNERVISEFFVDGTLLRID